MSKYAGLRDHLLLMSDDSWCASFPEIEVIISFSLPASARKHPAWWSNATSSHPHASAWLDAGFKTEGLDIGVEKVTFRRIGVESQTRTVPVLPRKSEGGGPIALTIGGTARATDSVALVACAKSKQSMPAMARDLYVSPLFRKSRRLATKVAGRWFVLSAEHGLLDPETVVAPYDKTLAGASRAEKDIWAERVFDDFCRQVAPETRVVLLAGRNYGELLIPRLKARGHVVEEPLAGLSQGRRLQKLQELTHDSASHAAVAGTVEHAQRFYRLMDRLFAAQNGGRCLGACSGSQRWPERGVYFFLEPGEFRNLEARQPRIVRVGTHATIDGAKSTLWSRLSNHRGLVGGGGNHRSSVFRRHVGMAMIRRDPDCFRVPSWGGVVSAESVIQEMERALEIEVSSYLRSMTLLWLSVDDAPSAATARSVIERNSIALLSGAARIEPSNGWLGRFSDREAIRSSGLWNVNYVHDPFDPDFFPILEHYVDETVAHFAGN